MSKLLVRAPIRADLAGGTLDLWPLYLFSEGSRTINVAISYHVECELTQIDDEGIEVSLLDVDYQQRYDSISEMGRDPSVSLLHAALAHFKLTGIRIATRSDAPRGSGLGASSALAVALVRGLSEFAGEPIEGEALVATVRDLETRLLGVPAGVQDYYPAVYGGLGSLRLEPGKVSWQPLQFPLSELSSSMIVHYSGVSHFSGTNNWEIYKRAIDGDESVRQGLQRIANTANAMERAFEDGDLTRCGELLNEEWENRKDLFEGVSTPELDEIIRIARKAGAIGAKVCGAGGGGCIVMLADPDRRAAVLKALEDAPGEPIDVVPVPYGVSTQSPDDSMTTRPTVGWKPRTNAGSTVREQFWHVPSGEDASNPFAMARIRLTFDESRRGLVHTVERMMIAPIDTAMERVRWSQALVRAALGEDFSSSPTSSPDTRTVDGALQALAGASQALREEAVLREKLDAWYNPELEVLSAAGESREAFAERSTEVAKSRNAERYERLEATLRLSLSQVRERLDRDQKEEEAERVLNHPESRASSSIVSWGQVFQDITHGRRITEIGDSPLERDSWDKVRQHQRTWERERQLIDDEVSLLARSIEKVALLVKTDDVKVESLALIWASELSAME